MEVRVERGDAGVLVLHVAHDRNGACLHSAQCPPDTPVKASHESCRFPALRLNPTLATRGIAAKKGGPAFCSHSCVGA